eukprot:9497129-Pyramimonas_sp.AAC.1
MWAQPLGLSFVEPRSTVRTRHAGSGTGALDGDPNGATKRVRGVRRNGVDQAGFEADVVVWGVPRLEFSWGACGPGYLGLRWSSPWGHEACLRGADMVMRRA